jgi:hypothetical protein
VPFFGTGANSAVPLFGRLADAPLKGRTGLADWQMPHPKWQTGLAEWQTEWQTSPLKWQTPHPVVPVAVPVWGPIVPAVPGDCAGCASDEPLLAERSVPVPWLLPFPDPLLPLVLPFSGMVLPHSGALLPLVLPFSNPLLSVTLPFSRALLPFSAIPMPPVLPFRPAAATVAAIFGDGAVVGAAIPAATAPAFLGRPPIMRPLAHLYSWRGGPQGYVGWSMVSADFCPVGRNVSRWSTQNHPAQTKPPTGSAGPPTDLHRHTHPAPADSVPPGIAENRPRIAETTG